ncbi:MAG TPA: B12-binding domain-containing radical SAM protein [Nitrospirae bacterium]|nr:ribosomal protein S12 methylthiotransferase RimO [bacterium BMS3Abin06]HDH11402.1 B12-binding domain-containing radical SAM protein [Nitrospirota bacterium]HDZ01444.1 B12-binding domain-containing radical SAM protein [Nitrospirota bacterium]
MIETETMIPVVSHENAEFDNSKLEAYVRELRRKFHLNNRLLLVQTLQFQLDAFNIEVARNRGYYAYPPAGLQCLVKALKDQGLEIEILDLNYELLKRVIEDETFDHTDWLTILDETLERFGPTMVGVTCIGVAAQLSKPSHPLTGVLRHLAEKNKYVLMAGGPIATDEKYGYLFEELCHFVVESEGENKINVLIDHLLDKEEKHKPTPGICFKYEGEFEQSRGAEDKVRVEGNLIDYYKYPIADYCRAGSLNPFSRMAGQDVPFASIQLNRGCRSNCRFCGVTKFMGPGVRQAPVQAVYNEIVYLVEEKGIRHFELLDDDFFGPPGLRAGVNELLGNMCKLKETYGISWSAGNGLIAGSIDDNLMQLIHDSGCIGFRIGIESGNTEILEKMRKPASVKSIKTFASKTKDYPDMFVSANYIIGLYGEETFGQMMDTYRMSCELDLDWSSYSTFQFSSKSTSRIEGLRDDDKGATECIPSKDSVSREITRKEGLLSGAEIFNIPEETVPSREQVIEIWYTFNFLSNYIYNKNLRPGGNHRKLVSWIKALQLTYPNNAYMPLFTGLGYVLCNDPEKAKEELEKTKTNIRHSEEAASRFAEFHLTGLVDDFPSEKEEVYQRLEEIGKRFPH